MNGLLFKARNVESLVSVMQMLQKNPDCAEQMGNNAYTEYWKDPWTLDRHLDDTIAAYLKGSAK